MVGAVRGAGHQLLPRGAGGPLPGAADVRRPGAGRRLQPEVSLLGADEPRDETDDLLVAGSAEQPGGRKGGLAAAGGRAVDLRCLDRHRIRRELGSAAADGLARPERRSALRGHLVGRSAPRYQGGRPQHHGTGAEGGTPLSGSVREAGESEARSRMELAGG